MQFWQHSCALVLAASACGLSACALDRTGVASIERMEAQRSSLAAAARLNIASFHFDAEIDTIYAGEMKRLQQLCDTSSYECLSKNFTRISRRVATVHGAPNDSSHVVGYVDAVFKVHDSYILTIGLEFEEAAGARRRFTWLESVGDWHYGIDEPGVRVHGDWIQLVRYPFPAESWLFTNTSSFQASVEPIVDDILALPSLSATLPNGVKHSIEPVAYFIESVANGEVVFRAEVATDMACGEDVKPPPAMPPSLRADAKDFFDTDGRALFSRIYQKGC